MLKYQINFLINNYAVIRKTQHFSNTFQESWKTFDFSVGLSVCVLALVNISGMPQSL